MKLIFLALFSTVQSENFSSGCVKGYYRDANGICRSLFDEFGANYYKVISSLKRRSPQTLNGKPWSHTVGKENCECKPYYKCRPEDVVETGSDCGKAVEVCCKKGSSSPEEDCGWGTLGSSANETDQGEFPWVVAILNVITNETWTRDEYIGGGSIVHPQYVLTVAHKVRGNNEKTVKCRAGQLMRLVPEPNVTQDRLVEKIKIHYAYDRQYLANDIALIKLKEPFDVSLPSVRPVCVAGGAPNGSQCFALGWGRRQYNSSDQDVDKLKKVQLPLVPREVCWRALQAVDDVRRRRRGQEPLRRHELHSSLLCAGGLEAQDTCVGDGGSPLVCQLQVNSTHARWAVYGLVAWGVGCGESGAPGVYVDVGQYRRWVHNLGESGVPPDVLAASLGR